MNTLNNLKLGYVGVESRKRAEWITFAEVTGMAISEESTDDVLFLRMDEHHHRLAIHTGPAEAATYVGWDCGSEALMKDLIGRLNAAGIETKEESRELCEKRFVRKLVSFRDFNGFTNELFVAPRIRNEPLRYSQGADAGFVTGDEGMGHVVYGVPNLQETTDFWRDVMGFRTTDYVNGFMDVCFLHCNPRHHSIAFMEVPQAPAHFQHIMLQLGSLDAVGRAFDRVKKAGLPVSATMGRHNNDKMVSFYFRSPVGFDVEVGWGAIRIDDPDNWIAKSWDTYSYWGHEWSRPEFGG